MRFGTEIFDLASLGQISRCQTALTLPPWVVYSVNTLQSYGLYITYTYIYYMYILFFVFWLYSSVYRYLCRVNIIWNWFV